MFKAFHFKVPEGFRPEHASPVQIAVRKVMPAYGNLYQPLQNVGSCFAPTWLKHIVRGVVMALVKQIDKLIHILWYHSPTLPFLSCLLHYIP